MKRWTTDNAIRGATATWRCRVARSGAGIAALVLLASGCQPHDIDGTYGKRRGAEGGASVSGTAVLAGMFEQAGHRVSTRRRLSPKLEESKVIVWAPDDFRPPTAEQREFLERWLSNENGRTLVYIGRDYDAAVSYWRRIQPLAPPEQYLEVARRLATAQAEYAAQRAVTPEEECSDWFTIRRAGGQQQAQPLAGPWSEGIDTAQAEIEIATRYTVPDKEKIRAWMQRRPEYDYYDEDDPSPGEGPVFETLLRSGDDMLVHRITWDAWSRSQLLVVLNGSFLLNLPLVDPAHRRLAGRLIAACGSPGKVVFLESGPGGPPVLDEDPDANAPTGFEVFTVWPIGLIVLHLIVLGIIACFAWYPIFGRPRQPVESSTSDFGKHVEALGELLEKTRDHRYAVQRLHEYQTNVRRDPGAGLRSLSPARPPARRT